MADSTINSDDSPGSRSLTWMDRVRAFISRYVTLSEKSDIFYRMFQLRMRPISIQRIQLLLISSSVLIILFWPEDYLLGKPPELVRAFAYWRGITVFISITGVLYIRYLSIVQEYLNFFYVLVISFDMALAGLLFGANQGLAYPWFDFLVFLIPMFSIVLSIDLFKRILIAACMTSLYVGTYILVSPENLQFEHFYGFLPLWVTVVLLNSIVGHSIFYFDYLTFINERKLQQQQQKIQKLARYDQLTKLYNRSEFNTQARNIYEQTERYGQDLALAMVDLDYFKNVNDNYGHLAGDEVLSRMGELIRESTRRADISCRYGGEEFCILMPQTNLEGARELAERLRRKLEKEEFVSEKGETFHVTCSIGVAEKKEGWTFQDVLEAADEGLYEAKGAGRNCVVSVSH